MKWIKLAAVLILLFVMAGCGTAARDSEWCQHDTMYKNWDHLKFSWTGYTAPTSDDVKKSADQAWWGVGIPAESTK